MAVLDTVCSPPMVVDNPSLRHAPEPSLKHQYPRFPFHRMASVRMSPSLMDQITQSPCWAALTRMWM